MINWQNDKKFLLDYIYLMYHVARIINIRTDITDKHMMTSIMVIEIWPSPSDVTSDFSRIICPFFRMLFLVSTSTLIWFPVKKKSNENFKGWNVLDRYQKVRIHKRFPYKSTLCTPYVTQQAVSLLISTLNRSLHEAFQFYYHLEQT